MPTDLLLVNPYFIRDDPISRDAMDIYPLLGHGYLAGYLQSRGYGVELLDTTLYGAGLPSAPSVGFVIAASAADMSPLTTQGTARDGSTPASRSLVRTSSSSGYLPVQAAGLAPHREALFIL